MKKPGLPDRNTSTRRGFLKRVGLVVAGLGIAGVVGKIGGRAIPTLAGQQPEGTRIGPGEDLRPTKVEHGLMPQELAVVTVLASIMIPSDGNGPGALDVGVVDQIDRMVASDTGLQDLYRKGFRAFDRVATANHGWTFGQLTTPQQRSVMTLVDEARQALWSKQPQSIWEKLEHKATWYYYRWYGVTNEAIDLFDTAYAQVVGGFYSSKAAWDWLGYDGPPFPFGYVGRKPICNTTLGKNRERGDRDGELSA